MQHYRNIHEQNPHAASKAVYPGYFKARKDSLLYFILSMLLYGWVARVSLLMRRRTDFLTVDPLAMLQIIIVLSVAVFLCFQFLQRKMIFSRRMPSFKGAILYFFIFYIVGMASALWSDLPLFSAYRSFEFLVMSLGTVVLVSQKAWKIEEVEKTVLRTIFVITSILLLGQAKTNGFSLSLGSWHSNTYGAVGAMLASYCWVGMGRRYSSKKRRKNLHFGFALGFGLVILSTSVASILALLAGITSALLFRKSSNRTLTFFAIIIITIMAVYSSTFREIVVFESSTQKLRTFTGRTYLWEMYQQVFFENPWLGQGYAVSARLGEFYATSTHNSFISVLCGTGLLGFFVYMFWLIKTIIEVNRTRRRSLIVNGAAAAALVAGLVNSCSHAFLAESWGGTAMVFLSFLWLQHLDSLAAFSRIQK